MCGINSWVNCMIFGYYCLSCFLPMFSGLWLIYISLYYIYICVLYTHTHTHTHTYMMCVCQSLSRVQVFVTPWTPLSMEFSRQEYWSGLPFSSPVDLPNPGIELRSPTLQADSLPSEPPRKLMYIISRAIYIIYRYIQSKCACVHRNR